MLTGLAVLELRGGIESPRCLACGRDAAAIDDAVAAGIVDAATMSVRLFDVVTRLVAAKRPGSDADTMFLALLASGLVQRFCGAITGDDVLLQVNILQFVPRCASGRASTTYLLDNGQWRAAFDIDPCAGVVVVWVVMRLVARSEADLSFLSSCLSVSVPVCLLFQCHRVYVIVL